jgi:hypothetical protein
MTLPGQPHLNGGTGWIPEPLTPHETTVSPPSPPGVQLPEVAPSGPVVSNGGGRRKFPGGSFTLAGLPLFLIPDDDPWDRERWRRLGEPPDPGAA